MSYARTRARALVPARSRGDLVRRWRWSWWSEPLAVEARVPTQWERVSATREGSRRDRFLRTMRAVEARSLIARARATLERVWSPA